MGFAQKVFGSVNVYLPGEAAYTALTHSPTFSKTTEQLLSMLMSTADLWGAGGRLPIEVVQGSR